MHRIFTVINNFKLLYFFLLSYSLLTAQINEKVVAKVGNYKIYESEFKDRFDFSAHPGLIEEGDKLSAKKEFLEQLIAEKLLSLEAQEKCYDTLELFNGIITPLENMFIRDALYSKEIKEKAHYSTQEISEGIERIKQMLKIKFLYSKELGDLQNIYSYLTAGASFDSILAARIESKDQAEPKNITFGTMDKEIEDVVYNLKPGEFTLPIASKDGYYILKLFEVDMNPDLKDPENVLEDVKRIVETRATYKRYLEYYRNFFSEHKVTADKQIFERLISIFVSKFKTKYDPPSSQSSDGKYFLRGYEINSALENLSPELQNIDFVKISRSPVKIKYFLNQLSHEGLYVREPFETSIRASLSSYIRKFIEDELLTLEGKQKQLAESPEVRKYINMWQDSYLSKMLMMEIFDSIKVDEEEAYKIYKQSDGKPIPIEKVNIVEILTDSLEVIETILKELSNGKEVRDLARQYTKRDSLREKGGEFGLFPVTMHGEIGKIASQMAIGDVYGPIKLDEGYSIFKLIERKEDKPDHTQVFDDIKDQIMMKVTLSRFENYINQYNAKLADKYSVEIYENILSEIENIYLNLVIVRYMGFGGEIFAVPYTEQFSGWYKIWQSNKEVNP